MSSRMRLPATLPAKGARYAISGTASTVALPLFTSMTERANSHTTRICSSVDLPELLSAAGKITSSGLRMNSVGSLKRLKFWMVTLELWGSTTPWRRIRHRLVRLPAALGGEHGVVDRKNALFGAVAAVGLLVLLPDDGELIEDISRGITGCGKWYLSAADCSAVSPSACRQPQSALHGR
jgi:hypothetical protein